MSSIQQPNASYEETMNKLKLCLTSKEFTLSVGEYWAGYNYCIENTRERNRDAIKCHYKFFDMMEEWVNGADEIDF